jgi:hypothetical protein
MGTNQDKIDAMKRKVFGSLGDSRNNSAKNAERIEEIENRLIKMTPSAPSLVRNNAVTGQASNLGGPPKLGLSQQLTQNLGPLPVLPLGKSSAANNQLLDFSNMPPPPALELRRSNTESYYDRKYSAPPANAKNQGPPLTLQNLPRITEPPKTAAPPILSFSRNATNSKASAPSAKNKEKLPKIEEEIEEEPEKPKAVAKKKNKKRSKPKSRSKARR